MPRKLWTGVGALALGLALLAAAQLAGASRGFRQGGILQVGMTGASVQVDPQLAYVSTAWWLQYATALKLFNYSDRRSPAGALLKPEVVARYSVSKDGRTWTFVVRRGFRFSDGAPVTAKSFAYAIDRAANKTLGSPAAAFITDPAGVEILGARQVVAGSATHVRGVASSGYRLTIRLRRPASQLPMILTMPFFQATSTEIPSDREVTGGYPSAGPYFFSANAADVKTELRRNPHYGGSRPHRLDAVEVQWNLPEEAAYRAVRAGSLDEAPLPAAHVGEVAKAYGVNRSRFWVEPINCIGWMPFNDNRGVFRHNPSLRRAVNWAVDRTAYAALAGPYAASPWTHILPPGFPGSIGAPKLQPYGARPNLARARKLAAGHFRSGKVVIVYLQGGTMRPAQADLVRRDLIRLGFKPENVTVKASGGGVGALPSDWDLAASSGMCADTPDPYGFFAWLQQAALSDDATSTAKIRAAARLAGNARLKAFGRLDLDLVRNVAPVAPMRTYNNRYLFSARVDPRSLVYQGVYQDWSIPALALK